MRADSPVFSTMLFAVAILKKLFFIILFFSIFYAVGDGAFFERSVIFLIFIVYIYTERDHEIDRLSYASILMLRYLKKNDDGEDELLEKATENLLQCLEVEEKKEYIMEANPIAVIKDEDGRYYGGILETPSMFGMLIWLAITYF